MIAPPGVEILGEKNIPVLSVAAPVSEAQEAAALESATAPAGEVEMLKEKKEDGTEGEAAKPGEKAPAKGADKAAAPAAKGAAPAAKGAAPAAKGAAPAGKAAPAADKKAKK
jgi:hypothetical protein